MGIEPTASRLKAERSDHQSSADNNKKTDRASITVFFSAHNVLGLVPFSVAVAPALVTRDPRAPGPSGLSLSLYVSLYTHTHSLSLSAFFFVRAHIKKKHKNQKKTRHVRASNRC